MAKSKLTTNPLGLPVFLGWDFGTIPVIHRGEDPPLDDLLDAFKVEYWSALKVVSDESLIQATEAGDFERYDYYIKRSLMDAIFSEMLKKDRTIVFETHDVDRATKTREILARVATLPAHIKRGCIRAILMQAYYRGFDAAKLRYKK